MRNFVLLSALCVASLAIQTVAQAKHPHERRIGHGVHAKGGSWARSRAAVQPWHGQHYYMQYGQPTALVVPPKAAMQQNYSWGVSQNTMTPIYHQFGYPAQPSAGGAFYATPRWPSRTGQFGVYPVRAPW